MKNPQKSVIDFLVKGSSYFHFTHNMRRMETDQSIVFLAGDYAYKLYKSAVCSRDNTTVAARLKNAQLEIEASKYLSTDVLGNNLYIGVRAIVKNGKKLEIVDIGAENGRKVVDYVIKMHRFPQKDVLYRQISSEVVEPYEMFQFGKIVGHYHEKSPAITILENDIRKSFRQEFTSLVDLGLNSQLCSDSIRALETIKALMAEKLSVHGGVHAFIARGPECFRTIHGNLDPSNIVYVNGGFIAFNPMVAIDGLRYDDVAKDVAFVLAPLYMYGCEDLAETFLRGYMLANPDETLLGVLPFWIAYACVVRGKSWLLKVDKTHDPELADKYRRYGYLFLKTAQDFLNGNKEIKFEA